MTDEKRTFTSEELLEHVKKGVEDERDGNIERKGKKK